MEIGIEEIINDQEAVSYLIEELGMVFTQVFHKYNGRKRDAYSFYLTGHCASFAYVLYHIFEGHAQIMDSDNHVVIEIGNHLYDIRGCVDYLANREDYRECPIDYFPYVELMLSTRADHDNEIREELITIGKEIIKKMKNELPTSRVSPSETSIHF